jgi:hypothetical protein
MRGQCRTQWFLRQQSQPGSQNLSAVPESGLQTSTTSLDVLCVQNPLLETVTFPSTCPPPPITTSGNHDRTYNHTNDRGRRRFCQHDKGCLANIYAGRGHPNQPDVIHKGYGQVAPYSGLALPSTAPKAKTGRYGSTAT